MAEVKIEQTPYRGWSNCYRVTSGEVEIVLTTDVGPRIIHFGFAGGQNMFYVAPDQVGRAGEGEWRMRGGHRLWIAPEIVPDTYALDNGRVAASIKGNCITLLGPIEKETMLRKEISVEPNGNSVEVSHRIINAGPRTRRLAPWAITQMAAGGTAFAEFPPRGCHDNCLQPTHPLVMWAYTDFSDPRWLFTQKYVVLRQDPRVHDPQKTGLFNTRTIGAYLLGTDLFVKRSTAEPHASYADFQCSFEMFTNGDFLELETLGPLADIQPDNFVTHVERWSLHRDVKIDDGSQESIDRAFLLTAN